MSRLSAYGNVVSTAGLIGFLAVMPGAGSACAQSLMTWFAVLTMS